LIEGIKVKVEDIDILEHDYEETKKAANLGSDISLCDNLVDLRALQSRLREYDENQVPVNCNHSLTEEK